MSYQASGDCVACDVDNGIAILDLRTNTYFGLDPVGADIWARIAAPISLDDLTAAIAEEYAIRPEECRDDIADLLRDMMQHGLVRAV